VTRRRIVAGAGATRLLAACGAGATGGGVTPELKTGVTRRMMQYGTPLEAITKVEVFKQLEARYPGLADWLSLMGQLRIKDGEHAPGVRLLAGGESEGPRFGFPAVPAVPDAARGRGGEPGRRQEAPG
jgi:hypothetical protein